MPNTYTPVDGFDSYINITSMMMIAFITIKSSLVPLIEVL